MEFAGYDSDPRELWEIPELRRFVRDLHSEFPYFFFLADLTSETLFVLAAALCTTTEVQPGLSHLNQEEFMSFLEIEFGGLNYLWDAHDLPAELNVTVSEAIVEYFARRQFFNTGGVQ